MGFDGIDGIGWDWDLVGIGHCLGWDAAPGDWGLLIGGWGVGDERRMETHKMGTLPRKGRCRFCWGGAVLLGWCRFCWGDACSCLGNAVFAGMVPCSWVNY